MTKKKVNQVQEMREQAQAAAKRLGLDLKIDPEKGLESFKMGRPLTMGEVKLAAQEKRPVWVFYQEVNDNGPRINAAKRVQVERECFIFTDGSSFASEMEIGLDHHPAEDDCCGEGEMKVYEAIKK